MGAVLQIKFLRYAIAIVSVLSALVLHFLLTPYLGNKTPFIVFYLSVVISALFGGFGPGILATLLSAVLADYFFIEPTGSFFPLNPAGYISVSIFATVGFLISYLSHLRFRSENALSLQKEQIKAQLDEMNAILEIIPTGVLLGNADCSEIKGNRAAYEMFDLPPGINISFTAERVEMPDEARLLTDGVEMPIEELPMQRVARTGESILKVEQELTDKAGNRRTVFTNIVPLFDEHGAVRKVIGAYADFTERKENELTLAETSKALARERERLTVALRATELGVYEWKIGEEIVWWSPEVYPLYGVEPETFVPTVENFTALIHPDDREEMWRKTEAAIDGGEVFTHEYRIVRPSGEVRWIANRSQVAFGADGKPERITGVAMDVTERKKADEILRESEEKFRTLGEAIPNLAWLSDGDGKCLYVNPAWVDYTGMTLDEFNERGWRAMHPADELPKLENLWNEANESGAMLEVETLARRHDGVYRWFMARSLPLKDASGSIFRWVGTLTDIHELKLAGEALKEANRNKELFLATLAHELRNPLAPVRGGLEIIRRSLGDRATVERMLAVVERQTGQLHRLVDDLLDISRITQGKIKLKKSRIALAEAIELALETSRGFIDKCGCSLDVSMPSENIYLDADLTRISQIILNLLNNAARYNKPQGSIALSVEKTGSEAVVSVRDTGVGIPAALLANIFEPYNQIAGVDGENHAGGIGIGLSVVKKLVEMHGGSVTAQSDGRDRGSEFTVRLPLAAAAETSDVPAPVRTNGAATRPSNAKRRVLVVDDNEDAAQMLEFLLKTENYDVRTAYSGMKALAAAAEFEPEIALLDIGLPDLTGYELARRLKQQFPALRLVAVSGWGQEEDRRRSREAGFDHHLVKPVEFDELHRLIRF